MVSSVATRFAIFVFLLLLTSGSSQSACPSRVSVEGNLKKCLFEGYDLSIRPALSASDTIMTKVHMYLRVLSMEEHLHTLNIHAWTSWEWTDAFLNWNPIDHDNIEVMSVLSDNIWKPDVSLLTTGDASMHNSIPSTYCKVKFSGDVHCVPPTTFAAHCAPDLTLWPFDEQTCVAEMGSWAHFSSAINLTLAGRGFTSDYMLPSKFYELKNVKASVSIKTFGENVFPTLRFTFVLRRHAAGYAATTIIPAFVLAVVTLLIFLLEPDSSERFGLCGCSMLGHILFMHYLSWAIIPNGDNVPNIVVFFRDSLLLVGASLAVTVGARMLLRMRVPPPDWLRAAAAKLLSSPPGQLLLLGRLSPRGSAASAATAGEDGDTLVSSNDASAGDMGGGGGGRGGAAEPWKELDDTWRLTATFIDRIALSVFFVALLALFGRYVA